LSNLSRALLFGSVGMDAVFAFVVVPNLKYDADTQTLSMYLPTSIVVDKSNVDSSRLAIKVKVGREWEKKSIGQNIYGAKVVITKYFRETFELAIHNMSSFKSSIFEFEDEYHRNNQVFVSQVKKKPAEAQDAKNKNKIAALILAKLTPPYISEGHIILGPTFEFPSGSYSKMFYVDVDVMEIWFYDKTTGAIMAKIKREDKNP